MTVDDEALRSAESAYEQAEIAFLQTVRNNAQRAALHAACQTVADTAAAWNSSAYRSLHAATGDERAELDLLTERTEVLQELWADLAAAYRVELAV